MQFGIQMVFQNFDRANSGVTDGQVYDEEIRLGLLAEELGFDALWPVEHHFEDYSFCPDNTQFLSYMAARTKRIKLGTGAVILPWNVPVRIAEKVVLLDHLCQGRTLFGMGRGLARKEYDGMGVNMDEARQRFDEASPMIIDALETGFIEGSGPFYPQKRTEIRPNPRGSFKERIYQVAMSPESVLQCAKAGARMVIFAQKPWEAQAEAVKEYKAAYKAQHGEDAPPIMICDFTYCDTDPARAKELGQKYVTNYLLSVLDHYELAGEHFKNAKGYESYAQAVDAIRALGKDGMAKTYLDVTAWGTPKEIVEKFEYRKSLLGEFDINPCFLFGGMSYEEAAESMRSFARHVIPALRKSSKRKVA
ncbi:LLM class flavin-dependent oxidoreductase [Tepidicaulis sp. LMO-SS28]|uniref:LLM class flavin-dependent oxidoreductase n=1 Tax=Tepidicaulis sp. LMO-SS28 TaxID=3447455 RepID=UPI003EE04727